MISIDPHMDFFYQLGCLEGVQSIWKERDFIKNISKYIKNDIRN